MKINSFYNLSPDAVINALEKEGFDLTGHCMPLNSYENRVYDLRCEDGSHIVAKFYRPGRWTQEQILEEHAFLYELEENEIPVCAPLRFADGGSLHIDGGIFYAAWPRTGGRAADELTDSDLEILGRMLARIHNNGAIKSAPARMKLSARAFALDPLDFLLHGNYIPDNLRTRYSEAVYQIAEMYESASAGVPAHRIHGDCHLGNLLSGSRGWFFLDFDDFLTGPAVQDVWMLVPARDREGLRQRGVFLEAYRQFRDFDSAWLNLIEPLRAMRYIRHSAWLAARWIDPAFPRAFPYFGTNEYWHRETTDLEEQIAHCRCNVPCFMGPADGGVEEERELTNSDFFWDYDDR